MPNPARILVIDDDDAIRTSVVTALTAEGFVCRSAADGFALTAELAAFLPDLVILDWMLPGPSGIQLAQSVGTISDAAVVMLTARDEIDDRLRGFSEGIDDYLVKPFAMAELIARTTAVLRRRGRVPSVIEIADLLIDQEASLARRGRAARPHGHRVPAPGVPRRESRPHALEGADPDAGVGLRRLRPEPRRGAPELAPPQDGGERPAAHPHRPRGRLPGGGPRGDTVTGGKRRIASARPAGDARPADGLRTGSLRLRAVVAILLLLVILLGALAVTVEVTLGSRLRDQIEDRLRDRASAATALVGTVSSDELAERLSFQGLSVLIRDKNGDRVVAGPSPEQLRAGPKAGAGLPGPKGAGSSPTGSSADSATPGSSATAPAATAKGPAAAPAATAVTITSSTITADDQVVTLVSKLSDGSTITLTADASSVGQTLSQLRWVMLAASGAFLLIAAVGLVLVVRASLRPLDRVTAVARSIAGGDRGRRLHPRSPRTETGRVALAFDEMLDAVEGAETKALEAEARVRAFVSDAAHELRTPVAGMRAAADTLVRSPVDREGRERLAAHVAREASRASRLIDDMLMMARVDRGLELELVTVDLGAVVLAEVERQRLRRPSLDLRVEIAEARSCATIDPDRIAQIVGNLLDNAARATGYTGRVEVSLRAVECAEALSVDVSDDGPGVPEADRERVFDRLVRLDAGRDQASGGAGLGLPIARGIARAHGGDVVCLPSVDGARFRLTVPQTTTPAQDPALAAPADAPAHAG